MVEEMQRDLRAGHHSLAANHARSIRAQSSTGLIGTDEVTGKPESRLRPEAIAHAYRSPLAATLGMVAGD
jgi:hypothetical protein